MATPDRLDPLPPVVVGGVTVLVDQSRPVAVLHDSGGSERVVTWPDAPLPARSASASVLTAPGCVWVVYTEHSPDGSGPDTHTAVRVGLDGQVAACEAGSLTPIGADEVGLWVCPDPYLAMGDGRDGDDDGPDDGDDVADGPPPWLEHAPVESWEDFQRAERQADEVQVAAVAETFLAAAPLGSGEEESFGWYPYAPGNEPEPPASLPEAPAPTGPVILRRVHADGQVEEMVTSRVVSRIEATDDGALRVVFHPTGPVLTPDGYGGYGVHYPQRSAEIDRSGGLPATVDLDALAFRPVEDEHDEEEPVVEEGDRVDLTGVAGTRWTPRPLDAGEVEAAVQAVREQYAALDEPRSVWTARDDRWHRVQAPYADLAVRVEGAWPDTEVVVDFAYLPEPGRLFRRRTRVFDDVGAPSVSPYLDVYLDEDLATTDLDQLSVRDGRSEI